MPKTNGIEGLRVLKILEEAEKCLNAVPIISNISSSSTDRSLFYIHDSTIVDDNVKIGEGTKIWHFSHILRIHGRGKLCD